MDAFHLFAAGEGCEEGLVWGAGAVVWVHLADAAHMDRADPARPPASAAGGKALEQLSESCWNFSARLALKVPSRPNHLDDARSLAGSDS